VSYELPLGEACEGEVLARVAYQMIARHYRYLRYPPELAAEYIFTLANMVNATLTQELELYIAAYAYHVKKGWSSGLVRRQMIWRARQGYTHRAILLWSYKAPRFRDPPVSNTGVRVPPTEKGGTAR